jgi:hypothetical protein
MRRRDESVGRGVADTWRAVSGTADRGSYSRLGPGVWLAGYAWSGVSGSRSVAAAGWWPYPRPAERGDYRKKKGALPTLTVESWPGPGGPAVAGYRVCRIRKA